MARLVRDGKLETRTARTRLPIGPKPYFRRLEIGFHLGYRRLSSGGTWIARRFAQGGRYREFRLGLADDTQDADGVSVLDYAQAQKAARDGGAQSYDARRATTPAQAPSRLPTQSPTILKSLGGAGANRSTTRAVRPRRTCCQHWARCTLRS
jgi:hypothetical protein